jgi:parallel beta helix pectate lyase-like protein
MRNRVVIGLAAATIVLGAAFLSVLRREEGSVGLPLVDTEVVTEPKRNDVLVKDGIVLHGTVRDDLAAGHPYVLHGTVVVPKDATVTVEDGAEVLASRDARVRVEGTLNVKRSQWSSNQQHPERQYWHGIVAEHGGRVELAGATIRHATAAITCEKDGNAVVNDVHLSENVAGIVSLPGGRCAVTNTDIERGRVGLLVIGGTPTISGVTFDRLGDALRIYHEGRPTLTDLTVSRVANSFILYRAEPDLTILGLTVTDPRPLGDLISDGADNPTHSWNNEDRPTGKAVITQ